MELVPHSKYFIPFHTTFSGFVRYSVSFKLLLNILFLISRETNYEMVNSNETGIILGSATRGLRGLTKYSY